MVQNNWSSVFSADVVEFVTLSSKYCRTLEETDFENPTLFYLNLQKILSALYIKSLALSSLELEDDSDLEEHVTEEQYNYIRAQVARVLGTHDDYLDTFVEDMKYSDKPILKTISEDLADIYQAVGNFVFSFQTEIEEVMYAALAEVLHSFSNYWGGRLLSAMRALHDVIYNAHDEY